MPHPRFRGTSQAGIRGDAIVQLDWLVGQVLKALDEVGAAKNTLVLFTSDNGPVLFDGYHDGAAAANGAHSPAGGLRGWKYLRYEGGLRVPLIARWPDRIAPGTSDAVVSLLDFFPTLAACVGGKVPAGTARDGQNLLPALLGQSAVGRESLVLQGAGNVLALRMGRWKFIPANQEAATGIGRGADPRDTRFAEARVERDLLFDLERNPTESNTLADSHTEQLERMRRELARIRTSDETE
jgi:arylsulfatase A-like enzyme